MMGSSSRHRGRALAALVLAAACSGQGTEGPGAPTISRFDASPRVVDPGATAELVWASQGASDVRLEVLNGAVLFDRSPMTSGSHTTPALSASTTFVLTARRGALVSTRSIRVAVRGPDTAVITSFGATPDAVDPGQSTTSSWQTRQAVEGELRANGARIHVLGASELAAGTFEVGAIEGTTELVLAVRGVDGIEVTASVVVTRNGPRIEALTATPSMLTRGDAAELAWSARNATLAVLSGSRSGELYRGPMLVGARSVIPDATETFTLTVSDETGASVSATEIITVDEPVGAHVASFVATPPVIEPGERAVLSWRVTNAPGGVELRTAAGALVTRSATLIGDTTVAPTETTAYVLTAFNDDGGDATASVIVAVAERGPRIL
ncbi:hypothetical protein L6R52_40550, partial [Myxococcota bacterium]|nr:hypothetical protein [Myxococcota bacterium]